MLRNRLMLTTALCALSLMPIEQVFAQASEFSSHAQQVQFGTPLSAELSDYLNYNGNTIESSRGQARTAGKRSRPSIDTTGGGFFPSSALPALTVALGGAAIIGGAIALSSSGDSDSGAQQNGGNTGGNGGEGGDSGNPALFETNEYNSQGGLAFFNASDAYARGGTGQGVTVAIVDSGIQTNHPDLNGKFTACYNAGTAQTGCGNIVAMDHGTHVAGIVGAVRNDTAMHGVSFDASMMSIDIFNGNNFAVSPDNEALAIDFLVANGAQISNHSYGSSGAHTDYTALERDGLYGVATNIYTAYLNALNSGVIMVWANGNDSLPEPSLEAALPTYYSALANTGLWVSVASVSTADGVLADYSNACGVASDWCISAPGGQLGAVANNDGGITSTVTGSGYDSYQGTSMAAPQVSGGFAVLMDLFGPGTASNLSSADIVQLMFDTANKTGIYANASLYGQGLMDLDAASTPRGPGSMRLMTGTDTEDSAYTLADSGLRFGRAFGNAGHTALASSRAGTIDAHNRVFFVDLSHLASETKALFDTRTALQHFGSRQKDQVLHLSGLGTLSYHMDRERSINSPSSGHQTKLDRLSFQTDLSETAVLKIGYNVDLGETAGLAQNDLLSGFLLSAAEESINPYLSFAREGTHTGITLKNSALGDLQVLAFSGEQEETEISYSAPSLSVQGTALEWGKEIKGFGRLSLMGGSMIEEETLLGIESTGAFNTGSDTPTYFVGASVDWELGSSLSFIGTWQAGWTRPSDVQNSLFSDFSTFRTDSFTLGLTGSDTFYGGDRFGLMVHQPIRVRDAEAALSLMTGRNSDGSLNYTDQKISLTPTGQELNIQGFYTLPLTGWGEVSAGGMVRHEPGHIETADPEALGVVNYRVRF